MPAPPTLPPRVRAALLVLGVWSLPAAMAMLGRFFEWRLTGEGDLWVSLMAGAMPWYTWALLTPVVLWCARRRPLRPPLAGATVRFHVVASLVLGHLYASAGMAWVMVETGRSLSQVYARFLPIILPLGLLGYWGLTLLVSWRLASAELAERTVQAARAEARLSQARLDALRAQLDPHFLFNTLNSISALVRGGDGSRATTMIARLGDLLRRTLDSGRSHELPLAEELELTRAYLAIETERLGDRLDVHLDVPAELGSVPVPALLLQPLVENAVLHGIAPLERPCRLTVAAARERRTLHLTVLDDGAGWSPDPSVAGLGLENVRARLEALHGEAASLEIGPAPGGGCLVSVRLPLAAEQET